MREIYERRSIRKYTEEPVEKQLIKQIIQAGIQAPSGKNGQPWKFIVVQEDKELLKQIAGLTLYKNFVETADALILVFLDKTGSYHYIKDAQAIGACIQNMLLEITRLKLGSCWIGEILNRDIFVKKLLKIDNKLDLMAVLTVGYSAESPKALKKKPLTDCLLNFL
ncbi:MAG: nitroreductase family protein [Firmicutes bacterium]|nr:nitroreductase family protein [Bacillota bacterium]